MQFHVAPEPFRTLEFFSCENPSFLQPNSIPVAVSCTYLYLRQITPKYSLCEVQFLWSARFHTKATRSLFNRNSKFKIQKSIPPTPDSSRSSRTKVPIAPDSSRQSQPETGPIVTYRDLPGAIETKNRFPDEPPSSHPFRLCFCRIQATRVCVFLFAVASWACAPGPGRSLPT